MPKIAKSKLTKKYKWSMPVFALIGLFFLTGGGLTTAAHFENNDAFCASCHSEPESTYYDRTMVEPSVDLASAHHGESTRCIDCHSGEGVTGRLSAIRMGSGDLLAYMTGTGHDPAISTVPFSDENCLKCHADIPQTQKFQQHFHYFLSKWQELDENAGSCVSCHTAHTTEASAEQQFMTEAQVQPVCEACHKIAGEGPGHN